LAQLFVIVRNEQLAKCCILLLVTKKYDLKTTEVVASGTKQKTEGFCFSQKTGFCFVGII